MASRIVGVDIGRDMIRAVELEDPAGTRPRILKYRETDLPEGAVRSGEVREVHTVASALKRLWASGGFSTKKVILGMGNQRVLARDLSVPRMTAAQIKQSLPFQAQDLLPVPVADVLLDFYAISESQGENGPIINGLLIAALKEAVSGNVAAVRLAGLEPIEVDLIPFALARLMTDRSSPATVAVIDVGANTTNVVVVTRGVPEFVRIIPAGGDDITRTLRERFDIAQDRAEQAKIAAGIDLTFVSPENRQLTEMVRAASVELLGSFRNTLSYFATSRPNQPIERVILTGGGAQLTGLREALHEMTNLPVQLGDPLAGISVAKGAEMTDAQRSVGVTVALGLAYGTAA